MTTERFNAEVGADIKEFQRKMKEVDQTIRELALGVDVDIRANITDFMTDVKKVQKEIDALDNARPEVEILADMGDVLSNVAQIQAALELLDAKKIDIQVRTMIADVLKDILAVQAALQTLDNNYTTVEIRASINDAKRDLLEVRALAQSLENMRVDIDVRLDDKVLDDILVVIAELQRLDRENVKIRVELELGVFYIQLQMVYAELQALSAQTVHINVDVDTGAAMAQIAALQALLTALNNHSTINVNTNALLATAQIQHLNHAINSTPRNIFIKIWMDYTQAMRTYANTVQAFAEAGRQMLMGAFLTLIPALSQLLSVLVGLLGGLGVMVGVLAGQFMMLASALSSTVIGFGGLAAVAIPTIKKLFEETANLNAEQQKARASWDAFIAVYERLVKLTESSVLTAFSEAMKGAAKILKGFTPLINSVANAMADMMKTFNKKIDSAPIQRIFAAFDQYGITAFKDMTTGIGHLVAALGSMMAAFAPAAQMWALNFKKMMASFAEWSDGLANSEGFKTFVAYVQEFGPMVTQIFGNLITGIVGFFAAFSEMGKGFIASFLAMTETFTNWANTLGQNQQFQTFINFIVASTPAVLALLANLWNMMINLLTVFAPVGAVVLDLTNKFLSWFNSMLETNKVFGMFIAILPVVLGVISALVPIIITAVSVIRNLGPVITMVGTAFNHLVNVVRIVVGVVQMGTAAFGAIGSFIASLVNPVTIVIAIIAALAAAFVATYKKVEWFRDVVQSAWQSLKGQASKVFGGIASDIQAAFSAIVKFAQTQLAKFSGLWQSHGAQIMDIVAVFLTILTTYFSTAFTALLTVIDVGWSLISGVFRIAANLIGGITDILITTIVGAFKVGMQLLQGDWQGAWNTIVETAKSIGSSIVSTLGSIIDSVTQIGKDIIAGLISGITSMFDKVASALGALTDKIPAWVKSALGIHSPQVRGFHYREVVSKRVKLQELPKGVVTTTWLETASVNVAKAEKIPHMAYGETKAPHTGVLRAETMGNYAAKLLKRRTFNDYNTRWSRYHIA